MFRGGLLECPGASCFGAAGGGAAGCADHLRCHCVFWCRRRTAVLQKLAERPLPPREPGVADGENELRYFRISYRGATSWRGAQPLLERFFTGGCTACGRLLSGRV